ncbi:probable receptor-like protein kinase At5g20050 [Vigna unguiculata]|uniref:Somatic embryogenesis receptor kinase 1 n=1 Tax=Vigna unguiculata TaxID=3917 RepID=A0A4D6NK84_VIGUN|nr:probable receptor-like protein kinase At5g20050 [Vigna unguiculata]QCE14066.1 somatic embryogenesis receptor kinase 1 [Vigna unguiculata]
MDERRQKIIAAISVIALVILIIVARVTLKLSKGFFLIFGAGVAVILAVFAYVLLSIRFNRRRRLLESQLKSEGRELRIEYSFLKKVAGVPIKFRYKELEEATDGFQALIGRGASASVFKGILNDGTSVAVKRIDGEERGEKEFRSEVAAIASVHHVNLVRLLGYCNAPTAPRYLVYEYVSNGSLDCWIFPKKLPRRGGCLSWSLRYKVAIDVAKGLAYLHHDCRSKILHLDVKPENILLDENYRAVVSDFGLAKLVGKDESQKVVSAIRGTRGYLAPEWLLEQGISDKTDIYSYGMVLLEIVGGRKNVCLVDDDDGKAKSKRKWKYFPKIVNEKVREGKFMEVVDPRLLEGGGVDERQVKTLVYVALWCVQEKPRSRPSMAQVVDMLEGRVRVELPPDTRMVLVDFLCVDDDSATDSRSMQRLNFVSNQRTQSDVECSSTYSLATSVLSGR